MLDLRGKSAVVTGGSRGIGAAVCVLLARAGADIAFGYRSNHEAAAAVVEEVEKQGRRALAVAGDLADSESCRALFEHVGAKLGPVDIVVGNAGIWKRAPIDEMSPESWRETMAANLDSIYHLCHYAARIMKPRRTGKVILIASTAGQRGEAFYAHYAASKGAVISLTRSLAAELGPFDINVNCVAPGWVRTDMTETVFEDADFRKAVTHSIPIRRIATPEDVAGPVVFLASQLARHIQGAVINVNGGSVLC